MHADGKIWQYTGVPLSGWLMLDRNPATVDILAARHKLFQRHRDGKIWEYTGTPLTGWSMLDQNPATVEIVASDDGQLYQRHRGGWVWRYNGTPLTGWELLDRNPATVQIAATRNALFQRHRDGKVWEFTGTPLTGWQLIGEDSTIRRINVSPDGALYYLTTSGNIQRYRGTPQQWELIGRNPATVQIAAAEGGEVYQRHAGGRIFRFTGTPISGWEVWDENPATLDIAAAKNGMMFQRHSNGQIFRDRFAGEVTFTLTIASVRCIDETEHEGVNILGINIAGEGLANDAMRLKLIRTSQKFGAAVQQDTPPMINLGSNYQDGTIVPMNLEAGKFTLDETDQLPMSMIVSFFLIEEDYFKDLSNIENAIREYARVTAEVHGTLSSIISLIPGKGWQIGATIGSIASVVEPGIANAVLSAANDVFPATDIAALVGDRNEPFPPSAERGVLRFVGHGGAYELSFFWTRHESVPVEFLF